ncbi:MAG: hypothetical protein NZ658_03000, partial [Pirellulales bacterium]|nr:hypothetical protein [Pirellulales bacterium]
ALVMGESGRSPRYDLTASKRLLMTARAREAVILVLRPHEGRTASAALSRWRIAASPSPARAWRGANGLPGLGAPRFDAALERVRGGPPRNLRIEWKNETLHVLEPAPLADRTAPGDDEGLQPAPATGGARIHRLAG